MTCAPLYPQPSAPPSPLPPSFLDQCASLGMALFARLEALVQSPAGESEAAKAVYQQIDNASRILKRIQETYVSARRALREGESRSASECLPAQNPVGAKTSRPLNGLVAADPAALAIPSLREPPHGANNSCCASAASPSSPDAPKAPAIAPPSESPVPECNAFPASPTAPCPTLAPCTAPASCFDSPALSKEPLCDARPYAPNAPAPAPTTSSIVQASPPSNAMAKILASVAALESRYAAFSEESPIVAQLAGAANPLSPSNLASFLPALSNGSMPVRQAPAQSPGPKKKGARCKTKRRR